MYQPNDGFFNPKHVVLYLLTYSMVQSPSWEVNWFAASQEIPRISRNPNIHYRTHKCPPPVSILGQPNPVHIPTSHLLEIHPNIIHPSTPRYLELFRVRKYMLCLEWRSVIFQFSSWLFLSVFSFSPLVHSITVDSVSLWLTGMDKTVINIQTMNRQTHLQYTKPLWFQELANISNKNIK